MENIIEAVIDNKELLKRMQEYVDNKKKEHKELIDSWSEDDPLRYTKSDVLTGEIRGMSCAILIIEDLKREWWLENHMLPI